MSVNAPGASGSIHIVMQGVEGVGTTFAALHLAQYFSDEGLSVAVFDSAPGGPGLAKYRALQARFRTFMVDEALDVERFEALVEEIREASGQVVVLDTESSSFFPLLHHVSSGTVLQDFEEFGRCLIVHCPLVGGVGGRGTLAALASAFETLPANGFIAWLNPVFGPVAFDGRPFEETKTFARMKDKLLGTVRLPEISGNMVHQMGMRQMTSRHLTHKEAMSVAAISLWDRQRFAGTRREIYGQLLAVLGRPGS
jgi:hypothetical protein